MPKGYILGRLPMIFQILEFTALSPLPLPYLTLSVFKQIKRAKLHIHRHNQLYHRAKGRYTGSLPRGFGNRQLL
jgi:hypothetical protein